MSSDGLNNEVRGFIDVYLESVAQLELLLLLHTSKPRRWSAKALNAELRGSESYITQQLVVFSDRGLLTKEPDNPELFSMCQGDSHLDHVLDQLAQAYQTRRFRVIERIYSKQMTSVRGFADAFRLRKDKDNG